MGSCGMHQDSCTQGNLCGGARGFTVVERLQANNLESIVVPLKSERFVSLVWLMWMGWPVRRRLDSHLPRSCLDLHFSLQTYCFYEMRQLTVEYGKCPIGRFHWINMNIAAHDKHEDTTILQLYMTCRY